MSSLQCLRDLICERLTAAAEEIFTHVERTVVEYEEEVDRQRRLLEIVYKPRLKLQRIDLPQQNVCNEEEVLSEQQLCDQGRNSSLDQEEPESLLIKKEEEETCSSQEQEQLELKEEVNTFIVGFDNEESDHMEPEPDSDHQLLSPVAESQDQTVHMRNITVEKPYMCNICKKHFLYELSLMHHMKTHTGEKPHVCNICKECFEWKDKLENHMRTHKALPQQNVYNEEDEVLTDLSWLQEFCNQGWNSTLDQEEPDSRPIIQEEEEICSSQEQEQLELKQTADTFMLTPDDNEESDHMEPEPDSDNQLLSPVAESQDQTGNKHVEENIVKYKEAVDNQPRLMKILWKPQVKLHRLDLTQQNLCNTKKVLTEQKRNSSLHQEVPESLQIKDEDKETCSSQEREQLELKEEVNTFIVGFDNEESDHMEAEPDSDHQLLSPVAESQDQTVHMRNITGEKPYMCNICNKFYEHEKTLKIHKRYHTRNKSHMCNICNKCFLSKSSLICHMVAHTGERPYVCNICEKSFGYKSTLRSHIRTHTGEKPYSCETCGTCYQRRSYLIKHKVIHTSEKPFMCNICNKYFKHKNSLKTHKRYHARNKPHMCNICKKSFLTKNALICHMVAHTGERPYVCNICEKSFAYRNTLMNHITTHTGEKPYSCETCGKCFGQNWQLIRHKKSHTGEKSHVCNICRMRFASKEAMKLHRKIHKGEKPNVCNICNKSFVRRITLTRHKRTHKGELTAAFRAAKSRDAAV